MWINVRVEPGNFSVVVYCISIPMEASLQRYMLLLSFSPWFIDFLILWLIRWVGFHVFICYVIVLGHVMLMRNPSIGVIHQTRLTSWCPFYFSSIFLNLSLVVAIGFLFIANIITISTE